jgi:hypothetical protein
MINRGSLVFPSLRAFGFVRNANQPSNANNNDNHSQFFSIYSISTVLSHKMNEGDSDKV